MTHHLRLWFAVTLTFIMISPSSAMTEAPEHTFEYYVQTTQPLTLTKIERQWLQDHMPLKIAFDGYFPPFSFLDEQNKLTGFYYDYWRLIAKKLNITYQIYPEHQWKKLYQAGINNQVDAIVGMVERPHRLSHFLFTDPIIYKRNAFFIAKNNPFIHQLNDLTGKKIAVVHDFQYIPFLKERYPHSPLIPYASSDKAVIAVLTGEADATINNLASINYLSEFHGLSGLKFLDYSGQSAANESFAIPKQKPLLATILQKAMLSVTPKEQLALYEKWRHIIVAPVDKHLLWQQALIFSAALLIFLWLIIYFIRQNRRLKASQKALTEANRTIQELNQKLEQTVAKRTLALKHNQQAYQSLIESLEYDYFFYRRSCQEPDQLLYISPSIQNILGLTPETFRKQIASHFFDQLKSAQRPEAPCHHHKFEIQLQDHHGKPHYFEIIENRVLDLDGHCQAIDGIAHDITELKQTQKNLVYFSYYDPLTDLPNRRLFSEKSEQILAVAQRHHFDLCLLFLDINHFKEINDTYGHQVGDQVLTIVGQRLKETIRSEDLIARLGGDEFVILLSDCNPNAIQTILNKIDHLFKLPVQTDADLITVTLSIGYAYYPDEGERIEDLLKHADQAMYYAKKHHLAPLSYQKYRQLSHEQDHSDGH